MPRTSPRRYDVWLDGAVFHFLTTPDEQAAYRHVLLEALTHGAVLVIATFAPDGPTQCSGLPVSRHDPDSLVDTFGSGLILRAQQRHEHHTPWGSVQPFTWIAAELRTDSARYTCAAEEGHSRPT